MKTRSQQKQPECPICYQRVSLAGKPNNCTHCFCLSCLTKWAQKENSCPLCKSKFTEIIRQSLRPLYSERARRSMGRQEVKPRLQAQTNPFVQFYVNSLDNNHFLSSEEDIRFLDFLVALDQDLDEL